MTRRSNYDPNTHTVSLYRPNKASVYHELGHVVAGEISGNPDLYWSDQTKDGILKQEKDANTYALSLARQKGDDKDIFPTLGRIEEMYENFLRR